MKLRILDIASHRNGICGAPFHVLLFEHDRRRMVATVFEAPGHIAVYDLDMLAQGSIEFGINSWRGDDYEPELRKAIATRDAALEAAR